MRVVSYTVLADECNVSGRQFLNAVEILDHILKGETEWAYGYDDFDKNWKEILEKIYKESIEKKNQK